MTQFHIKRIYDDKATGDGYRVLVDRLWPRGVSKERAALDEWAKDLAPSTELRKWFNHDSARFTEFTDRYIDELQNNSQMAEAAARWRQCDTVTLLYGARDEHHNEAVVLRQFLNQY